ncbi:hypothetical protein ACQKPE_02835 [Pseudomonas sp. NPDC089554]|uniref:hypothetical protein n=1 Tax=Pseudomonas sp. NPDC089554 TaxID=3390653 RepID=UPI003D09533D
MTLPSISRAGRLDLFEQRIARRLQCSFDPSPSPVATSSVAALRLHTLNALPRQEVSHSR